MIFHTSPHDTKKSMIVGNNALCTLENLGEWCINNVHDSSTHETKILNTIENE